MHRIRKKGKRLEKVQVTGHMQNSHMDVLKGIRYQALRFTQLIGFDYTIIQYTKTKCAFPKLIIKFLIF
jgi:hypothetical protein